MQLGENQQKFGILFEIIDVERQGFAPRWMGHAIQGIPKSFPEAPFGQSLWPKLPIQAKIFLLAMVLQRHYTLIHGRRPFYEMYYAKLQLCKRWSKIQVINKLKTDS